MFVIFQELITSKRNWVNLKATEEMSRRDATGLGENVVHASTKLLSWVRPDISEYRYCTETLSYFEVMNICSSFYFFSVDRVFVLGIVRST